MRIALKSVWIACMIAWLLGPPAASLAEFYRYVDRDGKVHYVDDLGRIPEEYLETIKNYPEANDHLSPEEKAAALEAERERQLERRQQQEIEWQRSLEQEAAGRSDAAEKKRRAELETKVTITDNQVIVPVNVENQGTRLQINMLLDTGASTCVIYRRVADVLNILALARGLSTVAGGQKIYSELGRVDQIRVGPVALKDAQVVVLGHEGPHLGYDGLLGMNFLRRVEYRIDYDNEMIQWRPIQE